MSRIFVLLMFLPMMSFAQTAKPAAAPAKAEVKPLMHQFYGNMEALRALADFPDKFSDKKNEPEVSRRLKDLTRLSREMKKHDALKSPGFKISQQTLVQHLADLERVYRVGNKGYARWMLKSTFFVCSSCHSQLPQDKASNWQMSSQTLSTAQKPGLDEADFLFATRRFDESIAAYDKVIDNFPKNGVKTNDLETALRKKLTIFARIKRDPTQGILSLEKSAKNKELPEYLKKNVDAWSAILREWQSNPILDPAKATDEDVKNFADAKLKDSLWDRMIEASDPKVVTYLQVSGVLYEYLDRNPKTKLAPQILLWLSLCDRQTNTEFFFSLADLYLKECILNYSSSPVAKQCYKELEKQTLLSYTGSSGTHVPPEVRDELSVLRKKLK